MSELILCVDVVVIVVIAVIVTAANTPESDPQEPASAASDKPGQARESGNAPRDTTITTGQRSPHGAVAGGSAVPPPHAPHPPVATANARSKSPLSPHA